MRETSWLALLQEEEQLPFLLHVTRGQLGLPPLPPEEVHPSGAADGTARVLVQHETREARPLLHLSVVADDRLLGADQCERAPGEEAGVRGDGPPGRERHA